MKKRKLRIGIDARLWGPYGRGVGRYVENLVENLEEVDKKNEYVIFLREQNFDLYNPRGKNFSKVLADVPWYGVAEQTALPKIFFAQNLDVLHVPHFNVPVFYSGNMVVTIHDLTMLRFGGREATTRALPLYLLKRLGLWAVLSTALRRASAIVTPSQFVKDDVVRTFRITPKKVFATYEAGVLGGKGRTREEREVEDVLGRHEITKPYILYVGGFYPHKNIARLLEAVKILNEKLKQKTQLVLVGAEDVFRARVARQALEVGALKYISFTGYVTDDDLVDLYKNAEAYVQPSLSEGFGLPSLEAMALGVPVVESNSSCLPEIAGEAALYFDPYDAGDIAEKLGKVLSSKSLRQKLVKKGLKRSKEFSWEEMARETVEVYKKVGK
ncbi:glycosyltransferase [Candidatus Saccharibacteria bacterium]|nr:glycosyltransferase [Candidatus Saccharibacteria bacterium]